MRPSTNQKTLNIIAKNPCGETIFTETIQEKLGKLEKTEDISKYIKQKLKWPDRVISKYDKFTQQHLLVHDAATKDGAINWSLNTDEIPVGSAVESTQNSTITIVAICFEKAPGFGCGPDAVLKLVEFVKIMGFVFVIVYNYLFPFKVLSKKFKLNEPFIKDTIKLKVVWRKGFISTDRFRYKTIVECSIMKKLGYKKIDNKWINTMVQRFKFPDEIIKGE